MAAKKENEKRGKARQKARLRDSAQAHLIKGRFQKALADLRRLSEMDPSDLRVRLKIGDVLTRMGRKEDAMKEYAGVARGYSDAGLLIQAIAVYKVMKRLAPSDPKIEEALAALNPKTKEEFEPKEKKAEEGEADMIEMEGVADLIEVEKPGGEHKEPPYFPLFSCLSKEEFSEVVKKMRISRHPPGALIIREGMEGDSIYFISEGAVRVFKYDKGGNKRWLKDLKEGELFGEFGYFVDAKRHAYAEALTEVELLEISKEEMLGLARRHPRISEALFELYKKRIMNTLLAFSPLFKDVAPNDRELFLDRCTRKVFRDGDLILRQGDPGDAFYMVKSGKVEIFVEDPAKGRLTLSVLKAGDFFGEISLITGRARIASARAIGRAEMVCLSKKDFEEVMEAYPRIAALIREWGERRCKDTMGIIKASEMEAGLL